MSLETRKNNSSIYNNLETMVKDPSLSLYLVITRVLSLIVNQHLTLYHHLLHLVYNFALRKANIIALS